MLSLSYIFYHFLFLYFELLSVMFAKTEITTSVFF